MQACRVGEPERAWSVRARLAAGVDVSPIGPSEADDAIIAETVADTVSDGAGAPADPRPGLDTSGIWEGNAWGKHKTMQQRDQLKWRTQAKRVQRVFSALRDQD